MDRGVQSKDLSFVDMITETLFPIDFIVPRDTNFFPPMERFRRYEQNHYFPLILDGDWSYMYSYLTPEYAKFGRSEGHQFFSTNG